MKNQELPTPAGRPHCGVRYDFQFIQLVLKEIVEGLPVPSARKKYNIGECTLNRWMRKFCPPGARPVLRRNLSVTQKRTIARAVCSGSLSVREAMAAYQVGESSIHLWKRQYGQENTELRFFNEDPLNKKKTQQKAADPQLHQLQQQLADAQLKIAALNTLIDVAEEQLKINIRKKPGARQS